jgi:hypothetical protein
VITATTKPAGASSVPVRVIDWDSATYDVTVQSIASGRIRCVGFSRLAATGGYAELLAVLKRVGERRAQV